MFNFYRTVNVSTVSPLSVLMMPPKCPVVDVLGQVEVAAVDATLPQGLLQFLQQQQLSSSAAEAHHQHVNGVVNPVNPVGPTKHA